ncbi:uncharacterized protein C8orf74 homolog isoform X1 [Haplochromis burtoni]|uniref:uncharacterized protein C8orf74 homolog isoform X1 n=2 Tax=Haplochromis burtoni TaxID=8153 RepID=UPI0003BD5C88|nr:uncharacterized protein C8orf74 homolog isoform X1 [Haplochromis burtoni]
MATELRFVFIRMDSLTESEIGQIARLQRDAGVQRLSRYFSWPEFSDERRCFHQEFVYDVVVFAADCGFSWPNVIRAAVIARDIFPRLDDPDVLNLLSLLREVLCEGLPNLTPVHRHDFTRYLTDACITRRKLFQAVVDGAANVSVTQLHLEVQLPPTPPPLAQGVDLQEWESQQHEASLTSTLEQKENELRCLRQGSRVTVEDITLPEDKHLDKQGIVELVRAAVRATESQIVASLVQEVDLLSEILQLKLQQEALATGRHNNTSPTNTETSAKVQTAKTKTGGTASGKAEGRKSMNKPVQK